MESESNEGSEPTWQCKSIASIKVVVPTNRIGGARQAERLVDAPTTLAM